MTVDLTQRPFKITTGCNAGDPCSLKVQHVSGDAFGSPAAQLYLNGALYTKVTPTCVLSGDDIAVSFTAADSLTMFGEGTGLPVQFVLVVRCTLGGYGPVALVSALHTIDPPGTGSSTTSSSSVSVTVAAGAATVAATIVVGGGGPPTRGHPVESGGTRLSVPGVSISGTSTRAATAGRLHYMPILVDSPVAFDGIAAEVVTPAGTVARLGVFTADTAWQPTGVVVDAGTIDTSTATPVPKVATCPATVLSTGRFLIGLVGDGSATFRAIRGGLAVGAVGSALGASPTQVLYYKAGQSTAAFSSPGTPWDTILTGTTPTEYLAFLRLTAV